MTNTENVDAPPAISRPSRALAIASLVMSVGGILLWIASIGLIALPIIVGGIISGHFALGQIKRAGGGGRWIAIAGLVTGYAGGAFIAYSLVSVVLFFGAWLFSGSH